MLSDDERRVLEDFKRRLTENGITVRNVIAFGSRVRGEATPESDLDVLVRVAELTYTDRCCISACAWEAGFTSGVFLAPVVVLNAQMELSPEKDSSFIASIRAEGVSI